jgi:peptide/nickel transport system substrate-binding protein
VKNKILLISLAVVLAISLGVVGCTTPVEPEVPGPEGTLVIARASLAHETTLPWTGGAIEKNYLSGTIYESLTLRDREGELLDCLATDWKMSTDGKTYTVTLRQGVPFHDAAGNTWGDVTAEDVKYTFERLMGEDSVSHIRGGLQGTIDSIETNGDYTVIFNLKAPDIAFMKTYSGPDMMGVVCKAYFEQYGDEVAAANPVGTGPYVLDQHVVGAYIQMRAIDDFDNHWRMGRVSDPTKYFKYIKFEIVPDMNARVLGLLTGDFDYVEIGNEVVDQIEGQPGVTVLPTIEFVAATDVVRLGGLNELDTHVPPGYDTTNPWSDDSAVAGYDYTAGELVRQAMNLAIDKGAIIEANYEGAGSPAPASISIPEWLTTLTAYPYDSELAEDLLDAAGYPRDPPDTGVRFAITLLEDGRYSHSLNALAVESYWEAVGIDVTVETWTWTALRAAWAARDLNVGYAWMHRTPPASGDPAITVNMAFDPAAVLGDFTNPTTEALRTAMLTELDPAQRTKKLKELGAYVNDIATQIFLVSVYDSVGVSTELDEPMDVFDLDENPELIHRK